MRFLPIILALSLAANLAFLARYLALARPAADALPARPSTAHASATAGAARQAHAALLAALAAGDGAALSAAGVSPEVIRQLAAARAFARFAALARSQGEYSTPNDPAEYWRTRARGTRSGVTREQRAERILAEKNLEESMRAAFGDDIGFGSRSDRYSFLPAEKQERLRRIERDYDEMMREINEASSGLQLPSDREKLKLLQTEKERDLAAELTPEDRTQLDLRTSNSARAVINRFGDALTSEDEYRRLFALQKAFDDRFSTEDYRSRRPLRGEDRVRAEAERQLNEDFRAALGETRWASLTRANDGEYRVLGNLSTRLNLPSTTADQVYATRENYAAQSLALQRDAALSPAERRVQLGALAERAKTELRATLTAEGVEAYAQHAPWLQILKNGGAFTTNSRDLPPGTPAPSWGTTVFPLPAPAVVPEGKP